MLLSLEIDAFSPKKFRENCFHGKNPIKIIKSRCYAKFDFIIGLKRILIDYCLVKTT